MSYLLHKSSIKLLYLLYSGKVWWVESLANLANRLQFAKLKPSKLIVTIDNPLADLFIRQTFFRQTLEKRRFVKHSACKLSHYMVYPIYEAKIVPIVIMYSLLTAYPHF